uniref:Uncharacterized protein n=1 Tax=Panthera leo TaxID=9689 RepID=A0A8C8XE77_PANLE
MTTLGGSPLLPRRLWPEELQVPGDAVKVSCQSCLCCLGPRVPSASLFPQTWSGVQPGKPTRGHPRGRPDSGHSRGGHSTSLNSAQPCPRCIAGESVSALTFSFSWHSAGVQTDLFLASAWKQK